MLVFQFAVIAKKLYYIFHFMYQYKSLNPPMSAACLPLESEYVDDVDLISEDEDKLQQILSILESPSQ